MSPLTIFIILVTFVMLALTGVYLIKSRKPGVKTRELTEFNPALAWLRAGILIAFFYIVAWATGVTQAILDNPIASSEQLLDPVWRAWVIGLVLLILVAYWGIWARFTIRFDRKLNLLPQILFGILWGSGLGQMILVFWHISEKIGPNWQTWQTFLLAYFFVSIWQWLLMDMYWDIYISPEHDSPLSIKLKVPLTHIPNVTLSLIFFAIYRNYLIFIALETLALVGASIFMRMPAPWSKDPTPSARRSVSLFWGLPRCSGYHSDDPENDPYLKAAHLRK